VTAHLYVPPAAAAAAVSAGLATVAIGTVVITPNWMTDSRDEAIDTYSSSLQAGILRFARLHSAVALLP